MITKNANRYPVSAQCKILGVPRATYYYIREHGFKERKADPLTHEVIKAFNSDRKTPGQRKIKERLARDGIVISRRRIARIMKENNLKSTYNQPSYKQPKYLPNEAPLPNLLQQNFSGYDLHTHIAADLTYVRIGSKWNYICLLIDLYNREIVGHAAGARKDARLVKSAFATLDFAISDIEVFHSDRGSEFDNATLDEMFEVFGIKRSLSAKGNPYDNAVIESTNHILKAEFIYQEQFSSLYDLQIKLNDYVHWYNSIRLHSTLGYLSPVEFREASLTILPK